MTMLTMQQLGEQMYTKGVREVIFVHGTAVGNDPLDIFNEPNFFHPLDPAIRNSVNALFGGLLNDNSIDTIKQKIKEHINNTLQDVGNYSPNYVTNFGEELGNGICEHNTPFVWGGGNSHLARLKGAVKLAATIGQSIETKQIQPDQRVLLIGHSHAGQIFALLSIFLKGGDVANSLLNFIENHNIQNYEDFDNHLTAIKDVSLDFVTFGTPVRYKYARYNKFRLLPVINHRSNSRLDLMAILNVENGDYVQQWGTEGTNLPSTDAQELELSEILDNAGFDLSIALRNAARSVGNNPVGRDNVQYMDDNNTIVANNILINYGDIRPSGDNYPFYCVKKVFGHGIYTTDEKMHFNTQLIVNHFYNN